MLTSTPTSISPPVPQLQKPTSISQPFIPTVNFSAATDRAAAANVYARQRLDKCQELDKIMTMVRGTCPVDFVKHGRLVPRHKYFSYDCGAHELKGDWITFKRSFRFEEYRYCWKCGLPLQNSGCQPACHKGVKLEQGMLCPWDDFIHVAIFCLWNSSKYRNGLMAAFQLDRTMSTEQYQAWALVEEPQSGKFWNGLEVFLWYCGEWKENIRLKGLVA